MISSGPSDQVIPLSLLLAIMPLVKVFAIFCCISFLAKPLLEKYTVREMVLLAS